MPRDYGEQYADYASIIYNATPANGSVVAKTSAGALVGILCTAAATTPTLTVYDVATATVSGTIMSTFTPVAGTLYSFARPIAFSNGLYVAATGSVGCTISYI